MIEIFINKAFDLFTKGINAPSKKNLADLPITDAKTNIITLILKTPAVTVKTLKGIGVSAAARIAIKAFSSYLPLIYRKALWLKT